MKTTIRQIGKSLGVVLPKSVLARAGLVSGQAVSIQAMDGAVLLLGIGDQPRRGWAEAALAIAKAGSTREWPEFSNEDDVLLRW